MNFFALCVLILSVCTNSFASNELKNQVRVRLLSKLNRVYLSGIGIHVSGMDYSFKAVSIPAQESYQIQNIQKNGHSFWLVKSSLKENVQIISGEFLLIEGRDLKNNAQGLPSQILLTSTKSKKIDLIGILPLEEYLVGVLASEMPLGWPLETLKAQAIAARSYALVVMQERSKKPFHLESSVLDQVFKHVIGKDSSALTAKAAIAVRATRGMQLINASGQPIKAFYHSDCGGKTVSSRNVWNSGVKGGEAVDDSCPTNPRASWTLTVEKNNLFTKLQKFLLLGKNKRTHEIAGLEFIPIPGDERVKDIKIAFNDGGSQLVNGNDFRGLIGFQELKSMLFSVSEIHSNKTTEYIFRGRGFGHGVGLCQWGSRAMGMQGKDFKEILKHYYPLAQVSLQVDNPTRN